MPKWVSATKSVLQVKFLHPQRKGALLQEAFRQLGVGRPLTDMSSAHSVDDVLSAFESGTAIQLTELEQERDPKNPARSRIRRIVTEEVKQAIQVGWILESDGRWSVTPGGRRAYQSLSDPAEFWNALAGNDEPGPRYVRFFDHGATFAIAIGAFALLGFALAIFAVGIHHIVDVLQNGDSFQNVTTYVVNEVLLVFIIVELVETAEHQIRVGLRESLQGDLVLKLLIIGILASVRHLLSVGAQLTTGSENTRPLFGARAAQALQQQKQATTQALQGIGVNAAVVLILVAGLILFARYFPQPTRLTQRWRRRGG